MFDFSEAQEGEDEEDQQEGETTAASELLISADEVNAILTLLEAVEFPALPPSGGEQSEATYTLTLIRDSNEIHYSWQGEAEAAWKPLDEVRDQLMKMADKRCNQQAKVFKVLSHPSLAE